jgi:hypothetical protein
VPELTVIYWRDIPAQVTATDERASARAQLSDRFEKAIDAAAMKAGAAEADAYLESWRKDARPCSPDLDDEVKREAARLEREYPPDRVRALVRNGGVEAGD